MSAERVAEPRARVRKTVHRWVPVDGLPWERLVGYDAAAWRGDVLRAHRERRCWTTSELAALLGSSAGSVNAYERNERPAPPDFVSHAAHVFGCSFRAFFAPRAATSPDTHSANIPASLTQG